MNRRRTQIGVFLWGWSLVACAPTARPAGHTLNHPSSSNQVSQEGSTDLEDRPRSYRISEAEPGLSIQDTPDPPPPTLDVPLANLPSSGTQFGHEGAMALEALSSRGRWVAYCERETTDRQAEVDPRLTATRKVRLFVQMGEVKLPISALLRYDESGRFFVALIDGTAWLIDAVKQAHWDLGHLSPDLRFDGLSDHRSFAFSDNALLVLSKAKAPDASTVWAIDLRGLEPDQAPEGVEIRATDQVIYRLEAARGHAYTVSLPSGSTTKYWPATLSSSPVHRCTRQAQVFSAFERLSSYRPDRYITHSWLSLPEVKASSDSLTFEDAPGFVFGFRDGWVRRLDNGRLMLVRHKTQKQIASDRCGGRILHADERTGKFLIACEEYEPVLLRSKKTKRKTKPKYRFDLYLIRPGLVRSLKADMARTGVDVLGPQEQRYIPIRPGSTAALVDFDTSKLITIEGDVRVLGIGRAGALLRRANRLSLWLDVAHPEETLDYDINTLDPVLVEGEYVSVGTRVFDLSGPLSSWELPGLPVTLSSSGHSVITSGASAQPHWYEGPMALVPPLKPFPDAPEEDAATPVALNNLNQ